MKSKFIIILLFGLIVFQSCEKDKPDNSNIFKQEYFYYTFDYEKIPLYLLSSQVFIEFSKNKTKEDVIKFLSQYSFFSDPGPIITFSYKLLRCNINVSDTIKLKEILIELNQDTALVYAVPVFTFNRRQPTDFCIPNNEIVCEPLISGDKVRSLISPYNLTIIKSMPDDPFYLLRLNTITSGFECLNIANSLYETDKFKYCSPNFYSSFGPYFK